MIKQMKHNNLYHIICFHMANKLYTPTYSNIVQCTLNNICTIFSFFDVYTYTNQHFVFINRLKITDSHDMKFEVYLC